MLISATFTVWIRLSRPSDFAHHWQSQLRDRADQWAAERAELTAFAADASARVAAADAASAALRAELEAAVQAAAGAQQAQQHSAQHTHELEQELESMRAELKLAADRLAVAEERARTAECVATDSATQAAMVWARSGLDFF
jgi:uncharacterized protein involved in exopolysaccharide biosynthesis